MSAFTEWFARNLPDITYFSAEEFLVKGADHYNRNAPGYGLNTDPPPDLWPNVIPLARALQAFRIRVGRPVHINSCYRSPRYNATLPGAASNSQHMQFKAADITVVGRGSPADWAATARAMRQERVFSGGVGEYKTFVHVDVRGTAADWAGSGVTPYRGTVLEPAGRQSPTEPPPTIPAVPDSVPPSPPPIIGGTTGVGATDLSTAAAGIVASGFVVWRFLGLVGAVVFVAVVAILVWRNRKRIGAMIRNRPTKKGSK